ncbi:MAG: hypothetical protein WCP55_15175 [Lentisphaerota bacterium]
MRTSGNPGVAVEQSGRLVLQTEPVVDLTAAPGFETGDVGGKGGAPAAGMVPQQAVAAI